MRVLGLAVAAVLALGAAAGGPPPFHVFNEKSSLVTFHRPGDASRYIGYRIVEDDPIVSAEPVPGYEQKPGGRGEYPPPPLPAKAFPASEIPRGEYFDTWQADYQDKTHFYRYADGVAWYRYTDATGTRVSIFKAVEDGLDAWMWLEPAQPVSGAHLVQQCLRMSGVGNTFKRRLSAFVPELSEYDLWDNGVMKGLSFTRAGDAWRPVAPLAGYAQQSKYKQASEYIANTSGDPGYVKDLFFTPAGVGLEERKGLTVDPGRRVQSGLVARESADGKSVAGMYWERTGQVSTHHPADCLHSVVDLGPTTSGKPLVVRGKLYWLQGTKDDLLAHWKRDFPN